MRSGNGESIVNQTSKFTPWHVDYWWAIGWLAAGSAGSWGLVLWGHHVVAAGVAVWLTVKGWRRAIRGMARERGVVVEWRAVNALRDLVAGEGYGVHSDILMTYGGVCVGNIDLVVSPPWSQARFVVEIKSFSGIVKRWYGLCRKGKSYRLWSPQKQVRGQCRYLGRRWHFPVLWMPESMLNDFFVYDGVLVVNGDESALLRCLAWFDQTLALPVMVTFAYAPDVFYTRYLRQRGFRFDGARWHGAVSKIEVNGLVEAVSGGRGRVEWVRFGG